MPHTVKEHFESRSPVVRDIYDTIVSCSREFGPVKEDPKKTSIHLNRRSAFAGIQTRKEFLILTVKSTTDIDDARITKHEQASSNRWHHEIRMVSVGDVDSKVLDWLQASYEISG